MELTEDNTPKTARGRRAARGGLARWVLLLAVCASFGDPAGAQEDKVAIAGVELTGSVQVALRQIAEASTGWQSAVLKDDRPRAEAQLEALHRLAGELGLPRLPDVSLAASARAVEAAEAGDFTRAAWALEAAEELDPGRSETAFAEADIARLQGNLPGALTASFRGYGRLWNLSWERSLWLQNLILWGLYSLLVTGGLFVGLLILTKGEALIKDLVDTLARWLGIPLAWAGVAVLLVGPLLLPYGMLWFLLLWSLLLWGYGSKSERWVLVGVWLLLGLVPLGVSLQQQRLAALQSPPVRVLDALSQDRLYGQLIADLGALQAALPEDVAVAHLMADLHRRMGQWPQARWGYRQVLDREPSNAGALVDLGVYYFLQQDYGRASTYFEDATLAAPESAPAFFNLSQAYLSSFLYDDSRRALTEAQELDARGVSSWLAIDGPERIQEVEGGFGRIPEIRARLLELSLEPLKRGAAGVAAAAAVGLFLLAVALHLSRRSTGYSRPRHSLSLDRSGGGLLLKVLIPGLASVQEGQGVMGYLALLLPVSLLLPPLASNWAYPVPWGYAPGNQAAVFVATVALVLLLVIRLLVARAGENR